jgi:hypothetical protein
MRLGNGNLRFRRMLFWNIAPPHLALSSNEAQLKLHTQQHLTGKQKLDAKQYKYFCSRLSTFATDSILSRHNTVPI